MCLFTSTFYHKKDSNRNVKCFVAKEDILVYKCLDCTDGEYSTPFQHMPIVFTKGKYVYNKIRMSQKIGCGLWKSACVSKGIHAYRTRDKAINVSKGFHGTNGTSMHYAVIPKDSDFYIGNNDDIVSNNLIVYREKRCFDRHYPNIIDFKQYIDKYLKEE